jgi:hypothetical protein
MPPKTKQIIGIAVAVIVIIIVAAGVTHYLHSSNKTAISSPLHFKPSPTSTFSSKPLEGFPIELTPANSSAPRYFENPQFVGAIFLINKTPLQANQDYAKQILSTSWTILFNSTSSDSSQLSLSNKKTGKTAQVNIAPFINNTSSLNISMQK